MAPRLLIPGHTIARHAADHTATNTPDARAARRAERATARIQDTITRILASAPALTDTQRDRLAALPPPPPASGR